MSASSPPRRHPPHSLLWGGGSAGARCGCGAQMLRHLGVHKMRLMTNNPVKRVGLEAYGLEIVENVPIEVTPNEYNLRYLQTKKQRMGHTLHL